MKNVSLLRRISARWAIAVLCGFSISGLSFFKAFESQELATYDLRLKLKNPQKVSDSIAIIEIGDDTLKGLGRWPLPRSIHAVIFDILREYGAERIIFDVLLSEPGPDDGILAQTIKNAGNVYLPLAFYIPENPKYEKAALKSPQLLAGITDSLQQVVAGKGHINVFVDPDGKIRRIPLFIRRGSTIVASMALQAASDELGKNLSLPAGPQASFLVNYPGRWAETFRHFSYLDILKAYAAKKKGLDTFLDLNELKGKVCFVGLTATGTSDIRPNPLEKVYPMVGLQASVFNSLITRNFITQASPLTNIILNILVFAAAYIISLSVLPIRAFFYNALLGLGFFLGVTWVFVQRGIWVDMFLPLLSIGITYASCLLYRFLIESRKRELLEKELEIAASIQKSFLPKDIPLFGGVNIAALLRPAKFVAGDLYDILPLNAGRFGVLVADVSGKGVPAALVMAQVISLFRIFALQSGEPSEVLSRLNKELAKVLDCRFVTAQYVIVDTGARIIRGACAGHLPLFFYRSSEGKVSEALAASGMPLGLDESTSYITEEFAIASKDKVLLYTDGWTDAANTAGVVFGASGLKDAFWRNRGFDCLPLLEKLQQERAEFEKGCKPQDDVTAVLLEF